VDERSIADNVMISESVIKKVKARITAVVMTAVFVFALALPGAFAPAPGPSFFSPEPSFADEKSDLESKLKKTKRSIKDVKSLYQGKRKKAETLTVQIAGLEASIQKVEKELLSVGKDIEKNRLEIRNTEADIVALEGEVGTQNSELMGRLRMMYMAGDSNMFEVLLDSTDILDFLTNLDMIQRIHAQDARVLDELNRKLDAVEQKKAELVEMKTALEQREKAEKQKKAELTAEQKKLDAARAKAKAEANEALENLKEMEAASKSIEAELKKLKSIGLYRGGKMGWPVAGSVTSGYGWRVHPISRTRSMHAGVDIAASTGTPVHAAADGVVVRASGGWNGGYGNMVIVDHGSDITTLYGHNSSLAASAGQKVKRGDVIAYVGSTGNSTGPHCHFEVRVKGTTQNPLSWL
jgi:murein DD-endopeptidase MepM/ murein hydrolase activator NlpD